MPLFTRQEIVAPDGRRIEVATAGNPDGRTVVFHHGTPGSTITAESCADVLHSGDFYFVTWSRPGYGFSDRRADRTVASVVDDVHTVLHALERTNYVAMGWSGGGPHALACGALDAPRCEGVLALASVAPADVDFDWTAGMAEENVQEFALAQQGGPAYEEAMVNAKHEIGALTADTIIDALGGLLPPVDREALAPFVRRENLAASFRHALTESHWGLRDDDQCFVTSWGFDPSTITVPVGVWFGDADTMVPPSHGVWLSEAIPTASARRMPREGHISLVTNYQNDIADFLRKVGV